MPETSLVVVDPGHFHATLVQQPGAPRGRSSGYSGGGVYQLDAAFASLAGILINSAGFTSSTVASLAMISKPG